MLLDINALTLKQAAPVAVLLAVSLAFFSLLPSEGIVYPHLINSGHALVFGLATYFLLLFYGQQRPLKELLYLLLLCLLFGLLVEIIQPYLGRERSLIDFVYDVFGCTAALLWYIAKYRSTVAREGAALRFAAIALVLASLVYPAYRYYAKNQTDRLFPVLADFEGVAWRNIVVAKSGSRLQAVEAPEAWQNETKVGKLVFHKDELYPGMRFAYLYKSWLGYDRLTFEIFSESEQDIHVVIRIHDVKHQNQYHDRFKKNLKISKGLNRYEIPLKNVEEGLQTRKMKMDGIVDLMIYMRKPKQEQTLYIDNIRLWK